MDIGASSWLVILLALAGANLPFFNERLFALVALKGAATAQASGGKARGKPLALRLLEMVVLYFLVGGAALLIEGRIGGVFPQKWEFYAVTGCLFLVLGFPGFVARYLYQPRR